MAGWIAAWSGGVECSQDVEPGSGVPKFDDGTGGRCEASVEGGVDREETVGTMPEPPGSTRDIVDRVVGVRGATRLVVQVLCRGATRLVVVVLWGDAGVLACARPASSERSRWNRLMARLPPAPPSCPPTSPLWRDASPPLKPTPARSLRSWRRWRSRRTQGAPTTRREAAVGGAGGGRATEALKHVLQPSCVAHRRQTVPGARSPSASVL